MDTSWQALENNAILREGPCRSEGWEAGGFAQGVGFQNKININI
jgi:hypothetical protein